MPGGPPMSPRLPGPDGALSAPVAAPVGLPPAANAGRPIATQPLPLRSSARLLILLVSVWGLGVAAHAPVTEYVGVGCMAFLTRQMATTPRRRREFGLVFAITSLAMTAPLLVVFGV